MIVALALNLSPADVRACTARELRVLRGIYLARTREQDGSTDTEEY